MLEQTQNVKKILSKILPSTFGVVSYGDVLPLLPCRGVQRIPEDAASVICCIFPYYTGSFPERNISRYAMIFDYHQVAADYLERCKAELLQQFPSHRFECFVDNSPIREVTAANLAGLGIIGKHGLLITPEYGDYVFIGEIVTNLPLQPDKPITSDCAGCGKCLKVCPTGALLDAGGVCSDKCRSHITQKKGVLSDEEQAQIQAGGLVWGCDICSDICPMNPRPPKLTPVPEFTKSIVPIIDQQNAKTLLKNRAFNYRGEKVILRNIELLQTSTQNPTQ